MLFVLVFVFILVMFDYCVHLALERESWSMCFSCIRLFILHVLNFSVLDSFSLGVKCLLF